MNKAAILDVVYSPAKSMLLLSREKLAQFYRLDGEIVLAEVYKAEFVTQELDRCMIHPQYRSYYSATPRLGLTRVQTCWCYMPCVGSAKCWPSCG